MNTVIPWISPVIAATITAIATVAVAGLSIFFARRIPAVDRNHSKRLAVIEIAKKRLEVRDQALRLELAATENGSAEQEQAKLRARQTVQRIISDANSWMDYLEWDSQITRVLKNKPHKLKSRRMGGLDRGFYWFTILFSWMFFVTGVLLLTSLAWVLAHPVNAPNSIHSMVMNLSTAPTGFIFIWAYAVFSREAQKIKFPRPDAPILNCSRSFDLPRGRVATP